MQPEIEKKMHLAPINCTDNMHPPLLFRRIFMMKNCGLNMESVFFFF